MMASLYVADDEDPALRALLFLVHLLQLDEDVALQSCILNKQCGRGNSCSNICIPSSLKFCSTQPCQKDTSDCQGEFEKYVMCWKKNLCKRPFLIRDDTGALPLIIYAGLCTVARQLVLLASRIHPGMNCMSLLGFKETCLKSHAEASIWTRFCEIEMIRSIKALRTIKKDGHDSDQLPKALKQLEQELQMPKHLPNASKYFGPGQKKWKSILQEVSFNGICAEGLSGTSEGESSLLSSTNVKSFSNGKSPYVCDFYLTLADVLLFAELHHLLSMQWSEVFQHQFLKSCPLLTAWFQRLQQRPDFALAMTRTSMPTIQFNTDFIPPCISESNNNISLHAEPVSRQTTKQRRRGSYQVVDGKLSKLLERTRADDCLTSFFKESAGNKDIDWTSMPPGVDPAEGELNPARAARKRHQITNMLTAVELVAKPGDVIVDFCAGGGHVGIVVAYFLPRCQVVLVENKEDSIARAANRIGALQLANITVCQSNVDYFSGAFNIGMALHACGLATDLVLRLCLRQRASFVVCPCCYGSMKPMDDITYPRSTCFAESQIDAKDYELLAHGADMVTWDFQSEKSRIGRLCMKLIDSDRSAFMQESGYEASFSVMRPEECSPKNHLLVGTSS